MKQRDAETGQNSLLFEIELPQITIDKQPHFRIMSAFEQQIEPRNDRYQYVLVAADPYEIIAFKVPNKPLDNSEARHFQKWDEDAKKYSLQISFLN